MFTSDVLVFPSQEHLFLNCWFVSRPFTGFQGHVLRFNSRKDLENCVKAEILLILQTRDQLFSYHCRVSSPLVF